MHITVAAVKWSHPFFRPIKCMQVQKRDEEDGWVDESSWWNLLQENKETEIWSMTATTHFSTIWQWSFKWILVMSMSVLSCFYFLRFKHLAQRSDADYSSVYWIFAQIPMQTETSDKEHSNRIQLWLRRTTYTHIFKFVGYNIWLPEPIELLTTIIKH
jgi:hypothetical protein